MNYETLKMYENDALREYEQALNSILSKHNVSLNDSQKSALISLFYSSCGATVGSIEAEHPTLSVRQFFNEKVINIMTDISTFNFSFFIKKSQLFFQTELIFTKY